MQAPKSTFSSCDLWWLCFYCSKVGSCPTGIPNSFSPQLFPNQFICPRVHRSRYYLVLLLLRYSRDDFCCTAQWLSHTRARILFSHYLPSWSVPRDWISLPGRCSRTLLSILLDAIVCIYWPQMPVPPLPSPLPLRNYKSFPSVSLFLFSGRVHLCHLLHSRYKWYHMVFVFLFLT